LFYKTVKFMSKKILLFVLFIATNSFAQSKKWTLEECVAHAYKNNISIKLSKLDSISAQIERKSAIGNFLPTLNGNGTHSWNIGLNQNITTGILENQTTQNTSVGLNSGITIYNGLENQNKLRRANLSILAAQYQISKMKDDIGLNVANAYLQIIFNKENLKVQQEQLSKNEKQLIRSTALVNAGAVPRGDLLDIKATVASNQQSVVLADNALSLSKLSLAQLLQLKDFQNFDVSDEITANLQSLILDENPTKIYEKAKKERYEIKIAKTNLDLADKDIAIAKGAYLPKLSAFYSFSTRAGYGERVVGYAPNASNPFSAIGVVQSTGQTVVQPNFIPVLGKAAPVFDQFSDYKGHSFGLQINIPILNGFAARNNVARTKVAKARTEIAMQQAEIDLERNVFTAFTNAKGAKNAYESALVAQTAREEAFNYAKEKYAVGLMNSFDFNQSQSLLSNAQSEVLRTKYDYIFKVKIVELYFGIKIFGK
jgi:outer membrane protein